MRYRVVNNTNGACSIPTTAGKVFVSAGGSAVLELDDGYADMLKRAPGFTVSAVPPKKAAK